MIPGEATRGQNGQHGQCVYCEMYWITVLANEQPSEEIISVM